MQRKESVQSSTISIAFAVAFTVVLFAITAATARAERLPARTYSVADGLPRDNVTRIRRDSQGFLWFCTGEGVVRFDGVRMTLFTAADGLPDQSVADVLETRRGRFLFATGKGLALLMPYGIPGSSDRPLFRVFRPEDPQARSVQVLYEDDGGRVWAGTTNGLFEVVETDEGLSLKELPLGFRSAQVGGAMAEPAPNTISITSLAEDDAGSLWVGSFGGGVFRIGEDGELNRFSTESGLPDAKVTDVVRAANGKLWAGLRSDQEGGICEIDPARVPKPIVRCFSERNGLARNWIRDILRTSDDQLWLSTPTGLCKFSPDGPQICTNLTEDNGICDSTNSLAEDRDGNLWIASPCGATKIVRDGFITFDSNDGLMSNDISAIGETNDGRVFVVPFPYERRSVSLFNGSRFDSVVPQIPPHVAYQGWGWRQTVMQDSKDRWWIPSGYGAFVSEPRTPFSALGQAKLQKIGWERTFEDIFRVFEDSRGDIWISVTGEANALKHWNHLTNQWEDLSVAAQISTIRLVSSFAEDRQGNIWIGASSDHGETAVLRWKHGKLETISSPDGAPTGWIEDLLVDSAGRLWIASTNDGVWRIDEPDADLPVLNHYGSSVGLSTSVSTLTEDLFGRIYVGTWRGVERLDVSSGVVERLTTNDGLPAAHIQAAFRDRQGDLWFGTDRGVARFRPKPVRERQPPITLITGVRVAGDAFSVSVLGEPNVGKLNLRSDQREVTIDFVGLGASPGESISYEYRFEGQDWISTNGRSLNFAKLAAGNYRLEVRGRSVGLSTGEPASVVFEIAAPIWQRWWFLLLFSGLVAMVVIGVYKFRLRQLMAVENVRTRIATDLHDDIGANLTRISLLSEVARKTANANDAMLGSIAEIARESVSSMNDIVWAISPDNDSGLDLARRMRLHAEELFSIRDVELDFSGPSNDKGLKLDVGLRRDILLIFKEAVSNAAKHSECTRVSVEFAIAADLIHLRVSDNGRGFDSDELHDGQGLRSMVRRAEALGGKLTIDPDPAGGTVVKFDAPV